MNRFRIAVVSFVLLLMTRGAMADPPAPTESLHDRLVKQYLDGDWDALGADLIAQARAINTLPPAEKADVDYIRRTLGESRPAWWKLCKTSDNLRFRPMVWGHTLIATFSPGEKGDIRINYVNGAPSVDLSWDAKAMDDPVVAGELAFTKGENNMVEVWGLLGRCESWSNVPPHFQLNMNEDARANLSRYLSFRGNVTGMYYATPRARRLALWQAISGWSHEYDKVPTAMSLKACGIFFAAEFFSHPQTYPTLKRPEEPPAEGAESHMIWSLQEQIRFHALAFAEDRALREAIRTFAMANASEPKIRTSGKITLPNGLFLSLDPQADKPLCLQRDAWIKAQYAKPAAK